jgi:hemerythrin-like domain-containing protein
MPSDEPLVQLLRCHRRLEEASAALETAIADRDLETAMNVAAFYARQGRRHEDDEELSLFPRLRGQPDLDATLHQLESEHAEHGRLSAQLENVLSGRADGDLWDSLRKVGSALAASYRRHIELEERVVFPLAERVLDVDARAAIHAEMQSRRR